MPRAYEQSHPWLTFSIDLRRASHELWMLLGEARSKCEHLCGVPLQPQVATMLHTVYLAKGVHATASIEGNTLSEKDVINIIEGNFPVSRSESYLKQEIDNIIGATNDLLGAVERNGSEDISVGQIKDYNKTVLNNLSVDDHVIPGEFSLVQVGVMRYRGAPKEDYEFLMERLCEWLNSTDFKTNDDDMIIPFGIIKSIVSHIYLAWIHPFGDGNGRTARLLEVRFLLEAGVPSAAAHLLSNHYNRTRDEYYRQLEYASKSGGDIMPFLLYAVRGFVDQFRKQLLQVKRQLWDITWINHVHSTFGGEKTPSDRRQLKLILELGRIEEFVPKARIKLITPELAVEYAQRTAKTISRDLGRLKQSGLIEETKEGVRAKKEILLAFLPRSRPGNAEKQLKEALRMKRVENQLSFEF